MAATESFDNASSADKGPMEQEVEITFVIKCFKGDPLPEPKKPAKTMKEGAEEGEEGEEGEEEEEGTPPVPLEELECRFTLTMFNGETDQSEAITFIKPPEENEEAAEEEEGEEPSTPKPTEVTFAFVHLPILHVHLLQILHAWASSESAHASSDSAHGVPPV